MSSPFQLPGRKLADVDPQHQGKHRETVMLRVSKEFALWLREESKRQTAAGDVRVTVTDVTTALYLMLNEEKG